MKKMVKTTGMVLMLIMAGTLTLTAQQNMRGMRMDTTRMHRMMMNPGHMQMNRERMMDGRQGGMCQCHLMQGMMQQGRAMQHRGMGMGSDMQEMMHQRMMIDNVPNLTDKQKKDIAVMRIDQQTEMKKLAEDMQSKMKVMRDAHKAAVEKILTPEQKKWLDENSPKPDVTQKLQSAPAKTK
jgi:hypothetical protein